MGKWIATAVQDAPASVISQADQWHLIKTYTAGDSLSTILGNSIGYASMAPSDYVISGLASSPRVLTFASGKSFIATAGSGPSPNLHFAFVDAENSRVLYVTDETTDVLISAGDTVQMPSGLNYTTSQTPA